MDKKDAIRILHNAAVLYDRVLNNQNLLVVIGKTNQKSNTFSDMSAIEIFANEANFCHLTGLTTSMSPIDFFNAAYNRKLTERDFSFTDATSQMKLSIIEQAFDLSRSFKMIGDYNCNRPFLKTEKLIGGEKSSVGFVKDDGFYVPNTLLKGDMRDDVSGTARILAILKKSIADREYTEIEYLAKNVFAHKLLETLKAQNPQIPLEPLRVNYQSLLPSQQKKENEFLKQQEAETQKEQLTILSQELSEYRERFVSSGDPDDMKMYLETQDKFLKAADETRLYGYAKELLKEQEKMYEGRKEILSYIKEETEEIGAWQDRYELSPRKADITIGIHNIKFDADRNTAVLDAAQTQTITFPIPPKRPFKALYVKIRDAIKDLFSKKGEGEDSQDPQGKPDGGGTGQTSLKEDKTEDKAVEPEKTAVSKLPDVPQSPINSAGAGIWDETPPEQNSSELLKEPVQETPAPVVEAAPAKKETKPKTKKSRQFEYGD